MTARPSVAALAVVAALVLVPRVLSAASGWDYVRGITITNDSGSVLTNYQLLVTLTTANTDAYAHMNSDGSDLRFMDEDDTTQFDYWIEIWSNPGTSKVWVEVPSIPAGTSTVHMWHGNSGASSGSNGDATFLFFDDFEDGNYTDKWYPANLTWEESDGVMTSLGGSSAGQGNYAQMKSKRSIAPNNGWLAMTYDFYLDNDQAGHSASHATLRKDSEAEWDSLYGASQNTFGSEVNIHYPTNITHMFPGAPVKKNTWHAMTIRYEGSHGFEFTMVERDDPLSSYEAEGTEDCTPPPAVGGLLYELAAADHGFRFDNIIVRKNAPLQPSASVGVQGATPAAVPGLSQWGLVIMGGLTVLVFVWRQGRKGRVWRSPSALQEQASGKNN